MLAIIRYNFNSCSFFVCSVFVFLNCTFRPFRRGHHNTLSRVHQEVGTVQFEWADVLFHFLALSKTLQRKAQGRFHTPYHTLPLSRLPAVSWVNTCWDRSSFANWMFCWYQPHRKAKWMTKVTKVPLDRPAVLRFKALTASPAAPLASKRVFLRVSFVRQDVSALPGDIRNIYIYT